MTTLAHCQKSQNQCGNNVEELPYKKVRMYIRQKNDFHRFQLYRSFNNDYKMIVHFFNERVPLN